jgi:hypothetical protein
MLGCLVYREDRKQFLFFEKAGEFDECMVDKSGRWLLSLENVDGQHSYEMRVIDLAAVNASDLPAGSAELVAAGIERVVRDEDGAVGHADMGHGYAIGADNWSNLSNAYKVWNFSDNKLAGKLVSYNKEWSAPGPNHLSHANARSDPASRPRSSMPAAAARPMSPRCGAMRSSASCSTARTKHWSSRRS